MKKRKLNSYRNLPELKNQNWRWRPRSRRKIFQPEIDGDEIGSIQKSKIQKGSQLSKDWGPALA